MKKLMIVIFACLFFVTSGNVSVKANDQTPEETKLLIEEITKAYLDKCGVESTFDLTYEQASELTKMIDKIKDNDPELVALQSNNKRNVSSYRGKIFVTGDSKTGSFRHGHAGIGSATAESVIEANPGDGVKAYYNRIAGYWSKVNSSIMDVRGATNSHYINAFIYANNQIGKPYSYNPLDGVSAFYCSELVSRSWTSAGISVGNIDVVLPVDIYNHYNTVVIKRYGSGF